MHDEYPRLDNEQDHGHLQSAISLYETALSASVRWACASAASASAFCPGPLFLSVCFSAPCAFQPGSHTIALNFVHAHECVADYQAAYACLVQHLRRTAAATVGGVSNSAMLSIIEPVFAIVMIFSRHCVYLFTSAVLGLTSSMHAWQLVDVNAFRWCTWEAGSASALPSPASPALSVEWLPQDPPYAKVVDAGTGKERLLLPVRNT